MPQEQPNILVLMADQLRQDALGCYGNEIIRTPNIDRLAERGVRFENAYCPTPICVASRMSFITGHRAARHHWVANNALPGPVPELPTLMTLLHRAGYHTQGIGKMHFRGRLYGFQDLQRMEEGVRFRVDDDYMLHLKRAGVRTRYPQGIRDLLYYQPQTNGIPEEHSKSRWVANESVAFLRQHMKHRPGKPFFLWSSWIAPHPPFACSEPYDSMYDPGKMPDPVHTERPLSTIPQPARPHRSRLDGAHLDPDRMRRIRALYAGLVTQVDDCLGQILSELEALGLADNTVVLFTTDHGDMLGDHGLSQKNVPYEAASRIPLLLQWPGRTEPRKVSDGLVGLEDFLPTLIEELGLQYDDTSGRLPGSSLLGEAGGGPSEKRDDYVIDYGSEKARWISVCDGKHKYALWAFNGYEELYDLREDPHEVSNIVAKEPDLAARLRVRALEWEREHGLAESFDDQGRFVTYTASGERSPMADDEPATLKKLDAPYESENPENVIRGVTINEGPWPENLPDNERDSVETYAEAFTRAVSKETALPPEKLSLGSYKKNGGHSLEGTPWEEAWEKA